jgi:hypothetical protein
MNELLAGILDAHGGLDRWNQYQRVDATIVTGGAGSSHSRERRKIQVHAG